MAGDRNATAERTVRTHKTGMDRRAICLAIDADQALCDIPD
jgi:hypothetical protein